MIDTHVFICRYRYSGIVTAGPVLFEYQHTGKMFLDDRKQYSDEGSWIRAKQKARNKKAFRVSIGYYYISRMAIKTVLASGEIDWWYVTNSGDTGFTLIQVSKYGKSVHHKLS